MTNSATGPQTPLEAQVNKSGFPFQLAIEKSIRAGQAQGLHQWQVAAREFPWRDGFVDLLLQCGGLVALIECKRVRDEQPWVFLSPESRSRNVARCRLEWWNGNARDPVVPPLSKVFCHEFIMCEGSPEADFCVIAREKTTTPTLERMTQELLAATHDVAGLRRLHRPGGFQAYVPVIVTNAQLHVCLYREDQLDILRGEVAGAQYEEFPFVRFRKTLVSRRSDEYRTRPFTLEDLAGDRERTVFVVNARHVCAFLNGFRVFRTVDGRPAPPEFMQPDVLDPVKARQPSDD